MRSSKRDTLSGDRNILRWIYVPLIFVLGFTGLGQMPIFKRYYISDIPGLGWSSDFYLTHYIHYLGAIFLFGFLAYVIFDYILSGNKKYSLTNSAYVRIVFLAGIVITGIFRVFKNLPDIVFSPGFTLFIDTAHLGFMMLYLFPAFIFLLMKSGWIRPNPI